MQSHKGLAHAAVIAMAMSLSACASMINPVEPTIVDLTEAVPAAPNWSEPAADTLPQTDWVESFGDEDLTRLVAKARADNPSLRRTLAQLDQAFARKRVSRAGLYPTLNGSSSATRSEGGVGFNTGSTRYGIGVGSSWEVDLFNRIRDQISSDSEGIEASAADVAALELSVTSRLASGWFDAIESGLLVDLSAEEIRTQERSLRLTQRRFESGLTGSSDVRLARSSIASAQAQEQSRLQLRDATLRSIQTLVRDYPDADITLPSDLPSLPAFVGAGTPADMLARRPDVIAAERRIAQAGLDVDVARKALYPSLSLDGSIGDQSLNSLGDVLDLKSLAMEIGGTLTAPIFQGGRLKAQVESQRAQLEAQIETYAETVLAAYEEVENALDAEKRLEAREAALRISLDEAIMAEERLELRYTEGLATILQLLDAQSRRINAEGQIISARAERLSNRVRLHVALGGSGYDRPSDLQENPPLEVLGFTLP
ncbi:RND transporter [Algimonas ampicilliniresistens]|uniref:RND transporter n=1 Tax=Algimonas ampicilliniresistens TaxID=1298735 RepID=A0ABQ5V658_9PROT|nr:efflux transporter outer membrane subunit [Algimonas ampicilliniresistens]GLQ22963.1 RND transporter [Algimonas ampicilliniresistens]